MAVTKLYNLEGKEVGDLELDDQIFSDTAKPELIYQVVKVMQSRQRQPLAHTKDRGEVRGGGKKPWKQKGTGRARHGSIRSPLWRGGGVTFGPRKESMVKLSIPRKMVKKATRAVMAGKLTNKQLFVFNNLKMDKPATKILAKILQNLKLNNRKILLISAGQTEKNTILSLQNLPKTKSINLENVNILDLMAYQNLMISKSSIEKLQKNLK